jgi:hypothetical protein
MIQDVNAFLFKGRISKDEIKICVCLRENGKWNESSVFYIDSEFKDAEEILKDDYFNILFAKYTSNGDDFSIDQYNDLVLADETTTNEKLYLSGNFFSKVESGYQALISSSN